MLWKCCTQYASKYGKLSSGHRTGKGQFSERHCQRIFKPLHNCTQLTQLAKWCSKFSKPGFNGTWTVNFQMFNLDLEKAEKPESKLPTSAGSLKRQESSRKTSSFALLIRPKPLILWITTNCEKFFKRWEYQTTWEICMQVKKQQLELDTEQQTGSELGKEYIKAIYCHLAYLTYMQSTSWEMLGWMKHKLESRLPGEISITSEMQMTPPLWQKVKKN